MGPRISSRRSLEVGIAMAAIAAFALLPLSSGTRTYPLTVVQGNSMYPTLQNGDIVTFKALPTGPIANGTVIIFVESGTGVSALDAFTRPVVVHRVIGTVVQSDGSVFYRTKGDNNQFPDPALVQADHVLGTPTEVIPKLGAALLFLGSPQGLVAAIGFVTLFYLGNIEAKQSEDKRKQEFLGALAMMVLNKELSEQVFKKLELALKYGKNLRMEDLRDSLSLALIDWVGKGGLEGKWKMEKTSCPRCSRLATSFDSGDHLLLTICPSCG